MLIAADVEKILRNIFIILLCFTTSYVLASSSNIYEIFKGAWFTVQFPKNFQVKPSLESTTAEGYDSAFFHSPNNRVVFYVFVPQWGGNPSDIALDKAKETLSEQQSKAGKNSTVTWYTITAKDGSYIRMYQKTDSHDKTSRWVIGVQFASKQDFDLYQDEYTNFKRSLKRYSD